MQWNWKACFYKDSVSEESIEIVDKLDRLWQGIADLIGFDFTDEDVVKKIGDFFPVTDETSPLFPFEDAEEAINFFQDMRIITARKAWFVIRSEKEFYSPSVQALIKICCEIIDSSPVEYHQTPNISLENMVSCMAMAIGTNDITYDVLRLFHKIVHDLEEKQARYIALQNKLENRKKISEGKQKDVEWRKKCFASLESFYENCQKREPDMSMHRAAIKYFSSSDNSAVSTLIYHKKIKLQSKKNNNCKIF